MQLILILGIVVAIAAVMFALQNNLPVVVTVAFWSVEGSLALVLLASLGLGVLIAGLLSSPTVIRGQWTMGRLRKQVAELERQLAAQQQRTGRDGIARRQCIVEQVRGRPSCFFDRHLRFAASRSSRLRLRSTPQR